MTDIIEGLKETVIQMIRDYKSRKFLIAVGLIAIIAFNKIEGWGLSDFELQLMITIGGAYVIVEGFADVVTRVMDKYLPVEVKQETGLKS